MWTRVELKEKAKVALKQNFWRIVLVCAILGLVGGDGSPTIDLNFEMSAEDFHSLDMYIPYISNIFTSIRYMMFAVLGLIAVISGLVLAVLVFNPIELGARRFLVKSLNETADMNELLYGFQSNYKNVVKVMFFRDMSIVLWSLLLVVPGIIKAYDYFMVSYLLGENPNLSTDEALQMSKEMMHGHTWDTFVLQLSFIGWDLLAAFTLGLVHVFYVTPYRNLTMAALFEKLNALSGYPARRVNSYRYENSSRPFNENDMI